jgi:hypothetical protein
MSYILDALNKSEKERARRKLPGIDALREDQKPARSNVRYLLLGLIVLVVANSLGVYFYFGAKETPESIAQPELAPVSAISRMPPEEQSLEPQTRTGSVTFSEVPLEPETPIVDLAELPLEIRERLPSVEVTAHIYASDPALRMVKINGYNQREGDWLAQDHQLIEITETGLVLQWIDRRYRMDVVEEWQAP